MEITVRPQKIGETFGTNTVYYMSFEREFGGGLQITTTFGKKKIEEQDDSQVMKKFKNFWTSP